VHSKEGLPFVVTFVTFDPLYYTGLQASVNPGSPFIWFGFAVMTIGLILVFYLNHRLVWVVFVKRSGKQDEVHVAGSCHKFKELFKREMNDLVSEIKAARGAASSKKTRSSAAPAAED
jgi:cytochrome c biogenesis protein